MNSKNKTTQRKHQNACRKIILINALRDMKFQNNYKFAFCAACTCDKLKKRDCGAILSGCGSENEMKEVLRRQATVVNKKGAQFFYANWEHSTLFDSFV